MLQATNRPEPLFRRALAISEKSYGPDHPNVAIQLSNLALLLRATNLLSEAEPLNRRAPAIDEKSYGPDHPNVATGINNLAVLLQATNRLSEAEPKVEVAIIGSVESAKSLGRRLLPAQLRPVILRHADQRLGNRLMCAPSGPSVIPTFLTGVATAASLR